MRRRSTSAADDSVIRVVHAGPVMRWISGLGLAAIECNAEQQVVLDFGFEQPIPGRCEEPIRIGVPCDAERRSRITPPRG
jgi:hypothetical protein